MELKQALKESGLTNQSRVYLAPHIPDKCRRRLNIDPRGCGVKLGLVYAASPMGQFSVGGNKQALKFFVQLYEVEREVHGLHALQRKRIRQERARRVADAMHLWLSAQRKKVPEGSATAKAIDYSLGR